MNIDLVRFIGRHINKNGREYFSYSGCGFEFVLVPQANNCSFTLSLMSELHDHNTQYIAIYLNDIFYSREQLVSGLNKVTINLNDSKETLVRVIKLNETHMSSIYLDDIILSNAEFVKLEPSKRKKIGFFGDSITCGYGIDDFKGTQFKTETEWFNKSYAYLTAEQLGMDYTVVARSGISIGIKIYVEQLFNEIYDTVDMFNKCETEKDLDYAVINLGTNDCNAYFENTKDEDKESALKKFIDEYMLLVERIIKDNPKVKLVLCYGMCHIKDIIVSSLEKINKMIHDRYFNACVLVGFEYNEDGANAHPYKTAHVEYAKKLVDIIKNIK